MGDMCIEAGAVAGGRMAGMRIESSHEPEWC